MPYQIQYQAEDNLILVELEGRLAPEERLELLEAVLTLPLSQRRVLADARRLSDFVDAEQSSRMMEAYRRIGRPLHRVALLHRPDFSPYPILSSLAVLEGVDVEEFTDTDRARSWLLTGLLSY